jgi:RNA-binding protein
MTLSSAHRQRLRSKAHALKPIIIIGNQGLTPAVHLEIERALEDHELIKIRVNAATREDRQEFIQAICEERQAELIQTIGHIAVIYRRKAKE